MNVLLPKEIDVSKINYSEPKSFGDHAKIVYLKYNDSPIYIQTPNMKCPYGLGRFDGDNGKSKYTLDLSFGTTESATINQLKTFLENLDNKILDDSVNNSKDWFKKKSQSREVASALYSSSVKVAMENGEPTDKYPPTFKTKIPYYNDEFKVLCYDQNKEKIDSNLPELLNKGCNVKAIVQATGIWFAGGKFGVTWQISQIKTTPSSKIIEYAFKDEEDEEEDQTVEDQETSTNNYVIDSEDDL